MARLQNAQTKRTYPKKKTDDRIIVEHIYSGEKAAHELYKEWIIKDIIAKTK